MSQVVRGTVLLFALLVLFAYNTPVLADSINNGLKITNAYSTGDKVAFTVLNTTSNKLYALTYNGHSFEVEPLNFSMVYQVRHWNGQYWLLQEGERGTVKLYTYRRGKLRIIKAFSGGSLCTDNDLRIKWNGEEYFLTFIGGSPKDDPITGECYETFHNYILKDENLIPLNVSGSATWIPALNAWLIGESLVDENGRVLGEYNFSETGIYSVGLVIDGNRTMVTVSSDGGWVKIFTIGNSSLVLTYNRRWGKRDLGEGPYPPAFWIGKPILFDIDSNNVSRVTAWLFNGTDFVRIHTFENTMPRPLATSKRGYILSRTSSNTGTDISLNLFEVRNFSLVQISSLKVKNNYLRYYLKVVENTRELRGFPALKVEPRSMLVIPREDSVFLFTSTNIVELISGNSTELPIVLRDHDYRASFCCEGVILFNENKAYLFKNGEFIDITPKMLSALLENERDSEPSTRPTLTLIMIALVIMMAAMVVFVRKR